MSAGWILPWTKENSPEFWIEREKSKGRIFTLFQVAIELHFSAFHSTVMQNRDFLRNIARRYPLTERIIQLPSREIAMTVVEEPDSFLETLSREDHNGTLHLPYWIYLWSSSIGLAHHLHLDARLAGQRILEVGCGFGLAGIVGCQQGGKVLFTDCEIDALLLARYNVWQHGCEDRAGFAQMDWNAPCVSGKFSFILASDVIYEEKNWQSVIALLQKYLAADGEAMISEPSRSNTAGFLRLLEFCGFSYEKQVYLVFPEERLSTISVYCVKRT